MEVTMSTLRIHIDRLTLEGFEGIDADRVGEAVRVELGLLIAAQGSPSTWRQDMQVVALEGGAFQVADGADEATIGRAVAQSVYGGLQR